MKGSIALALCSAFIFCSLVNAQNKDLEVRIGGGAAPTLGSKDFKELYSLAIHFGGDLAFFVSPQVTIGGNLHYGRFGIDEAALLGGANGSLDGGSLSGFELIGMIRYYLKPPEEIGSSRFYVLGGLGIASYKQSDVTVRIGNSTFQFTSSRETDLMLSFGLGSKFGGQSSVNFFVEATLSIVFADPDNATYLPLRAGVAF